jgi:predicted DNA binding CopG/RHH family protein
MKKKVTKPIPSFVSEAEEREFWMTHDSAEYLDWSKGKRSVFPNLKPSTQTISLRLPEHLLDSIKSAANKRDVPYQSLMKIWLQEKLDYEIGSMETSQTIKVRTELLEGIARGEKAYAEGRYVTHEEAMKKSSKWLKSDP